MIFFRDNILVMLYPTVQMMFSHSRSMKGIQNEKGLMSHSTPINRMNIFKIGAVQKHLLYMEKTTKTTAAKKMHLT